ncbi:MAG: ScpA family protein [Candidatus Micropelagos thuwalensis]|nr:ScpA family protein [Candidatus Micropelagos thuwalensis]
MTEDMNNSGTPAYGFVEGPAYQISSSMRGTTNTENVFEIDVDGFEGPLDILLNLARVQKVDLKQISILQLAEQYLEFIGKVQSLKIEIAADYLVMASWLAYLKSRLLLPKENDDENVSAEEMAARLVFQLQRLEAMRDASAKLMTRNQLGRDFFSRGMPEGIRVKRESYYDASLYELLTSYSTQRLRNYYASWKPTNLPILSIERARLRLERILGKIDDWEEFDMIVMKELKGPAKRRTTAASSFAAMLEFARDGKLEIQQNKNFGKILMRRARPKSAPDNMLTGENGE